MEGPREDEDDPLSPVQWREVAWIIMSFSDVFVDHPGTAKGWDHKIITPPDVVVRTPFCPVPPFIVKAALAARSRKEVTVRGYRAIP